MSSRGFTRGLEKQVRVDSGENIALIDAEKFVDLWIEHIDTMPDEGKKMLSLKKVYILDSYS